MRIALLALQKEWAWPDLSVDLCGKGFKKKMNYTICLAKTKPADQLRGYVICWFSHKAPHIISVLIL